MAVGGCTACTWMACAWGLTVGAWELAHIVQDGSLRSPSSLRGGSLPLTLPLLVCATFSAAVALVASLAAWWHAATTQRLMAKGRTCTYCLSQLTPATAECPECGSSVDPTFDAVRLHRSLSMLSADVTLGRRSAQLLPLALFAAAYVTVSPGRPPSEAARVMTIACLATVAMLPWNAARRTLSKSEISTREYCANE